MSAPAISIRNLGKCYRVNHAGARRGYRTLRESLARAAGAPWRRMRGESNGTTEDFWALKDVDFDIERGEVVGIIGRNGAGKSTLLKILSHITSPSLGEVTITGRIGSLLEVGTGFHPELTGGENIYMNGSILGMSRREIERKFDDIVAFADVERFLDTPVKRYSSGMYVRLAFAVAAHLTPEVIIVDEVLSVGDHAFQKKCLGKLADFATAGRTVLLVSHHLAAISNLSTKVIWLEHGEVRQCGRPRDVLPAYAMQQSTGTAGPSTVDLMRHANRRPTACTVLKRLSLFDDTWQPVTAVLLGAELRVRIDTEPLAHDLPHDVNIEICDAMGTLVAVLNSRVQSAAYLGAGRPTSITCYIRSLRLLPGYYRLNVGIGDGSGFVDRVDAAAGFLVEASDIYGTGFVPSARDGFLAMDACWLPNSGGADSKGSHPTAPGR